MLTILAVVLLLLALLYSTAAWEQWGPAPPQGSVLVILGIAVGCVWILALQARGPSVAWAAIFTALVMLVVRLLYVGRKRHGEHDGAAR